MKYEHKAFVVDAEKYEIGKGLEDGVELWTDVVTKGWFVTDKLIQIKRENGTIVCPYVENRRGKTFLREGDYIITDPDGYRQVCGEDLLYVRYSPIEQ